jgi:hypothetical protein
MSRTGTTVRKTHDISSKFSIRTTLPTGSKMSFTVMERTHVTFLIAAMRGASATYL